MSETCFAKGVDEDSDEEAPLIETSPVTKLDIKVERMSTVDGDGKKKTESRLKRESKKDPLKCKKWRNF